ncbi:ciliogenesis-associated TTC17-interacting [Pelobates cultripes]|uniref:Ciliogenesis-associated TTC17-interacting protein n=1 Tax=Pelobates cultripes TaxID=61616 RepID=A0AAD1SL57_PELCU|nr:ciliogenesis-associated TTC17-interacting [Pelobates cultripes]
MIHSDDVPITWHCYFLSDGHLASRVQIGSPVIIRLSRMPILSEPDEQDPKPVFGRKPLIWQEDVQLYSNYLDRKAELIAGHETYLRRHPEMKILLADFMQFLLLRKPEDVITFAAEFFGPFSTAQKPGGREQCVRPPAGARYIGSVPEPPSCMEEAERTPGPSSHSHVYSTSSTAPSAGHSAALLVKGTAGYTMFAFRGRRESLSSCPEAAIMQCLVFSSSGRISPPNWPLSSAGFRKYPRACHYFCIAEPKGPPAGWTQPREPALPLPHTIQGATNTLHVIKANVPFQVTEPTWTPAIQERSPSLALTPAVNMCYLSQGQPRASDLVALFHFRGYCY